MFWNRPSISDDLKDWIEECFDWFDARFPPPPGPILPTRAFFTTQGGTDEATARSILAEIAGHLDFRENVEVVPLDLVPAEYRLDYNATGEVAGTYHNDEGLAVVSYDPALMQRPLQFINILTHELMHARLEPVKDDVPGGEGAHELATDLGCVIAGFGVFQLQAADDAEWTGYMSQQSRAYALAVFLARRGMGQAVVDPYLSARCQKLLGKAIREYARDVGAAVG